MSTGPIGTSLLGTTLGRVELQSVIGEGTSGVVYRGRHTTLATPVAVKVLKHSADQHEHRYRERFLREARLSARLDHPGIVRVIDCGEEHGHLYLIMEFVEGFSLENYLKRRSEPLAELTVIKILAAVAGALHAAHSAGIVHRDLKPANLLLSRRGQLKLADLGLAKESGMAGLTQEQVRVGSPAYMSPEALTPGLEVDARSDLYALGVIGYRLLFNTLPFTGSIQQVGQGHLAGNARFDHPTQCSKPLVTLIRGLMARDRGERCQSAAEFASALRPILDAAQRRTKKYTKSHAKGGSGSGSREATSASASGSGDFTGLVSFMEQRLGSHATTIDGGQVVHTTTRERLLVWILLIGVLAVAIGGWVATSVLGDEPATSAEPEPAAEASQSDGEASQPDVETATPNEDE